MLHKKLSDIQKNLKAPKGQYNAFGKYKYRNCEDIMEAVKPLLGDLALIVSDDIQLIGDRYYVKATATLSDGEHSVSVSAFAREALDKKGMDDSQITGATSSYARKYALNGLFAIDDTKDADTTNTHETKAEAPKGKPHPNSKEAQEAKQAMREADPVACEIILSLANESTYDAAREIWEEIQTEAEKIRIWNLLNTNEKNIMRSLKEESA